MDIDKIVAICFLIGGLIANTIGLIVDIVMFDSSNYIDWINLTSTAFGTVFVTILFFTFFLKKQYGKFNYIILAFFTLLLFPVLLLSSPEGVFVSYLALLAPAIGLMHYKFKNYYKIGIIALIFYCVILILKVHFGINILNDFMKLHYVHFLGGVSATYIFSLLVTTFSTKKLMFFLEKDALTGVKNRLSFERDITDRKITFGIMLDIDHFKKVNDTYGHKVGDIILKSLCNIIGVYTSDTLKMYRYGGEEFFLISYQNEVETMTILKAIWIALNWQFTFKEESFSISLGMAKNNGNSQEMILKADEQLYKAKEHGRHQAWYEDKRFLYS